MRKIITLLVLLATVFTVTVAEARGGRSDDCTPGSTDPDCAGAGGR